MDLGDHMNGGAVSSPLPVVGGAVGSPLPVVAGAAPPGNGVARLPFRQRVAAWLLLRLWPRGMEFLARGLVAEAEEGGVDVSAEDLDRLEARIAELPELKRELWAIHRARYPRAVRHGKTARELLSDVQLAQIVAGLNLAGPPLERDA
jgi:hypothetical protein